MGFRIFSEISLGLSMRRLVLLVLGGIAAIAILGLGLMALRSVLIASIVSASLLAALLVCILVIWAMARSRRRALADMHGELQPRLKVLGVRQRINSVNGERSFDLVVRNEGAEPIDNCSAAVCSIRMTRFAKARGEQTLDMSVLYDQEVPLALAVPSRGGAANPHSFGLRPREMQRIPLCSRLDGSRNPLQLYFAAGVAEPLKQVPDFAFGEIAITIFGGPSELDEKLHLSVRENGALEVLRVKGPR